VAVRRRCRCRCRCHRGRLLQHHPGQLLRRGAVIASIDISIVTGHLARITQAQAEVVKATAEFLQALKAHAEEDSWSPGEPTPFRLYPSCPCGQPGCDRCDPEADTPDCTCAETEADSDT
jgi:hypothetical protein